MIKRNLGGIFFATTKVIKSKMAAVKFMKCTLYHIFATTSDINMSEDAFYIFKEGTCLFDINNHNTEYTTVKLCRETPTKAQSVPLSREPPTKTL